MFGDVDNFRPVRGRELISDTHTRAAPAKIIFLQSFPVYDINVTFYDKVFRFMIFIENFEMVSVT